MNVFTELLFTQGYVVRPAELQSEIPHPRPLPEGEGASRGSAAQTPSCAVQDLSAVQCC